MAARQSAIACARVALQQWSRDEAIIAVAIAGAESGWRTNAAGDHISYFKGRPDYGMYVANSCNGYTSFGLWQINLRWHYDKLGGVTGSDKPCVWRDWLWDASRNAQMAHRIYEGASGWTPWSVYNAGTYKAFLAESREAVKAARVDPEPPPGPQPPPEPPWWPVWLPWPTTSTQLLQVLTGAVVILSMATIGKGIGRKF